MKQLPQENVSPWLLPTIGMGVLLNPLNTSMIAMALTRITADYHLTFAETSWMISSYYLASAVTQPLAGKMGDRFGHKLFFLIGLTMVAVACLLAPFSPTYGFLLFARIIQAMGSAIISPSGFGIVRNFISRKQGRNLGVLATFSSGSAAFGPSIGGFAVQQWDWPSIFLINLPIIAVTFLLALAFLPAAPAKDQTASSSESALDLPGALLFIGAVVSLLLLLLSMGDTGNWPLYGLLTVVLAAVFLRFENSQAQPFIPLQLFVASRSLQLVYLLVFLANIILYTVFFSLPLYLESIRGFIISETGFIMLAMAAMMAVIAPYAGQACDRYGFRRVLLLSNSVLTTGVLLLLLLDTTSPGWMIFLFLLWIGFGIGINNVSLQIANLQTLPRQMAGMASGLFMTVRYLGTIFSAALLGTIFGKTIELAGMHRIMTILAAVGVLAIYLCWRLVRMGGETSPSSSSSAVH